MSKHTEKNRDIQRLESDHKKLMLEAIIRNKYQNSEKNERSKWGFAESHVLSREEQVDMDF